jgi:hypothetical protein
MSFGHNEVWRRFNVCLLVLFNGIGSSNHFVELDWKGNVKRTQLPADTCYGGRN